MTRPQPSPTRAEQRLSCPMNGRLQWWHQTAQFDRGRMQTRTGADGIVDRVFAAVARLWRAGCYLRLELNPARWSGLGGDAQLLGVLEEILSSEPQVLPA